MAQAVYWVGQDGNIYYGSGQEGAPVMNLGNQKTGGMIEGQGGIYDPWTDNGVPQLTYAATKIADPALQQSAPAGGGGTTQPALNEAGIRNTQGTIDQLPALLQAALATERTRYDNAIRDFGAQESQQRGQYKEGSDTNQLNYDSTFMDSIRAGIKGLGGLFALLRGTGAAGGTAQDQVRDVVGAQTAQDIRGGADVREENQGALDTGLETFLTDLKRKKEVNADTFENNQRAVRRDTDTQLQDLYSKMAGFYGDAGRTAEAESWMNRAGEITPRIAQNSRTQLSKYDTTPVQVQAPELTAFSKPTQPNIIAGQSPQQVGSGIFAISDRRKEKEQTRTPVLAGA